jgi:ribosomal protein S2
MVVIPDIHNNDMILRETNPLNIPVIGLVNSSCATQVTYPIFGNANSVEIVHFFCHFLAVLIAKEVIQQDYKNKSHRIFAKTR